MEQHILTLDLVVSGKPVVECVMLSLLSAGECISPLLDAINVSVNALRAGFFLQ